MQPLRILIAEDDTASRLVMNARLRALGFETFQARDGEEAIRIFERERPDIVVLDQYMPGMNGSEALVKIREASGDRWVPILVVTGDQAVDTQVRLLALGADDYLIKPLHEELLHARLKVVTRTLSLHREVAANNLELRRYRDANENELRVVKHLMSRMIQQDKLADPKLDYWILPAAYLSGDLIAAARTPDGVLHVMLADGTGHGLAAALNVLPIVPSFYAMTAKGLGLDAIVNSLNTTVKQQLPVDRFVAATLVAVDYRNRAVRVWNGGNPPVAVLDDEGRVIQRLEAKNLALGIASPSSFQPAFDTFDYVNPCQLLMFSDGVLEAVAGDHTQDGPVAVEELIRDVPQRMRMKTLRSRLVARDIECRAGDDMTVAMVRCDAELDGAIPGDAAIAAPRSSDLALLDVELALGPDEMRTLDVISMLLDHVNGVVGAQRHFSELCVVLTELYTNALDHGVLGLKSILKQGPNGIMRYAEARATALRDLKIGSISIRITEIADEARPSLKIWIRDSGLGFDYAASRAKFQKDGAPRHGRGLGMLYALCSRVEFQGYGNEVSVWFALDDEARRSSLSLAA